MSNLLPKELQSAYQRWEMASFGDDRPSAAPPPPPPPVVIPPPAISQEEIEAIREEARRSGYAAGLEQGRSAGREESLAAITQEMAHLRQIAEAFGTEIASAGEVMAEDMLDLALDLSKGMLHAALAIRPELMIPIVREAIHYLPVLQQPARIFLNPADAIVVQNHMEEELAKAGWRVLEDSHMARGGCRIETASNQIDASMQTRWQRLVAALGKDTDWLMP